MAFEEVVITEEDRKAASGSFFKFAKVGDRLVGRYVSSKPSSGQYAKPGQLDYTFKARVNGAITEVTISPSFDLAIRLKKASESPGGLKPGHLVEIVYTGDVDTGQASPMKQFKLSVDRSPPKSATPTPPPPPPPPAAGGDDIDF